jgi:FixJ family two-component response regulator
MPGINGLELQRSLEQEGSLLPIIFLTGRGDIATSVQAMKHGAVDFLTKPVDDTALLAAVHDALAANRAHHRADSERAHIAQRPGHAHRARATGPGGHCRWHAEQADRRGTRDL